MSLPLAKLESLVRTHVTIYGLCFFDFTDFLLILGQLLYSFAHSFCIQCDYRQNFDLPVSKDLNLKLW